MDPLALLLATEQEETEEPPPRKKKGKKKKMSPAMIKKMQAKIAEELRQQLIKQKQEYLRQTKIRVQSEWEMNRAKAQVYEGEFSTRLQQMNDSFRRLSEVEDSWEEYIRQKRIKNEWEEYLNCGRLPMPSSVSQMNSYIFVWTELEARDQMSYCIQKTDEVMQLLHSLEEVIGDPGPDRLPNFLKDMKELRSEFRRLLQENIDRATFNLFSKTETEMIPINVTTSKYFAQCPQFRMSLWAELTTPIPSTRGKEIRQPLKVAFEESEIVVTVPVILLDVHKVMRSMWVSYDHWSDTCRTHDCPELPTYYTQNLRQLLISEFDIKTEVMNHREKLEITTKKKVASLPPEPTLSQEIFAWDSEPQRALSDEIIYRECEEEDNLGHYVKSFLNEFEVNLRERTFLGDILFIEIFHRPPQPKYLRFKHSVTLRKVPPNLSAVDYYVKYPPPEPEEALEEEEEEEGVNEEQEEEKKVRMEKLDPAEELKKLVIVELKPCQSVVWFEYPQLANWDPNYGYWSREDIHDITYNEEEGTITFKTGRLGLIGLHVSRYLNFPYEDWVFEPSEQSGVNFFLKTPQAELFFNIRDEKVCLEFMKNVPTRTMNWILGRYYIPTKLMEHLKKGGIDVFPAPDAASYIDGIQSKHVVIESNIYQVWGIFSDTFRFKRSKFNQLANRADIVFQAQEIYKDHQVDFCLIQTAMCSSYVLNINEESEVYSSAPAPSMKAQVDLYGLLYNNSTRNARRQSDVTNFVLVQTIKEFLSLVRPLSFS